MRYSRSSWFAAALLAACVAAFAAPGLAGTPLATIIYSANTLGQFNPCPT